MSSEPRVIANNGGDGEYFFKIREPGNYVLVGTAASAVSGTIKFWLGGNASLVTNLPGGSSANVPLLNLAEGLYSANVSGTGGQLYLELQRLPD